MKLIQNLKIRNKLLILLFLLLFPLLYFVATSLRQNLEERSELQRIGTQLTESEKISNLIHHFQKERARIIAAAEGDPVFLQEAKASRTLTDASAREMRQFLESTGRSFADLSLLNNLQLYRSHLDERRINILEFRDYSRDLIFSFLNRIDDNASGISNVQIGRELKGYRSLVEAKVHLSRIRSLLMKVLLEGRFSYQDYALFSSHETQYHRALDEFLRAAPAGSREDLQTLTASADYKGVTSLFLELDQNPALDLAAYDPVEVYNLFTRNVENFKAAEDQIIGRIRGQVSEEISQRASGLYFTVLTLLLTLGLAILFAFYIISIISNSLSALRVAANRVRLGATDVTINIHSTDEIGSVADAFRGVVQKNLALAQVAQAIGEGRYEVEVEPQGPQDTLSHSLKDMKGNLHRLTTDNEKRNWILTGVAELNSLVSGESALDQVAAKVISFLCAYSGSDAGILYLHHDSGELVPEAGIGVQESMDRLASFQIGNGQVGQAVSERQIKVLENVPDSYLTIKTGLAEIQPVNIIILPLVFSSTVVGAVELCSRQPYSERHLEFFRTVAERVAIFIHTLQAHLQTQELLYQTQNQAEELETQQEELRQLNAELKASEEELKVNQEELQEKNAELEEKAQLLEEQFEALAAQNKSLEQAREAIELKIQQVETVSKYKSEFLANMSHELRTPLNSILILSRLLADNPQQNLLPKQAEHAQIIHKSGGDLLKLINEILDLSKIESGLISLEREEVPVKGLDLESVFQELAQNKQIAFSVSYDPDIFETITTDPFRLEQILKNFLSNAIKFTEPGGSVRLSVYPVKENRKFFSGHLSDQKEIIAFAVSDTGIGIPKEKQEEIFEAFHQADSSTTRKYGGTGLGLTISKELASLLGGAIKVESEPGQGSTFTLFLPRHLSAGPAPASGKEQAPPVLNRAESVVMLPEAAASRQRKEVSVLIVEDDKAFNDILADFAQAKNLKVYQAYTGQQGFDLAKEMKPDAVMLDIQLPDMLGWEVLRQIREDKELRHTNVHVMSAYDNDVVGNGEGNEEYLPKPVTLEMLHTAFSAISDRSIETILIVEDNEVENQAVAELLLAHNYKSLSAFSAEEAEKVLARHKVDCVILDLNLPGMKGYEWMARIRSKPGLADIPIIVYSGKDLSQEEETRLKKFANTIIIKNEYSYLRLLDEVQLFLHQVNQKFPAGDGFKMKLHVPEEVLRDKKVLIVDDDVRNVYSLSSLLELQGMKIVVAYDGQEALEKLQAEEGIDLVLMDVMMPEMDGIEAIGRIREQAAYMRLPIIALTAKAMKEDKDKCLSAGASDYIPKPVDTEKLLTLMRVWLYEA